MRLLKSLLVSALLPASLATAGQVHQHGVAHLDLVLEPPGLAISFRSPLANLIGFEHQPATPEEQAAWERLLQEIKQAGHQISLPAEADCSLSQVELHQPFPATSALQDRGHDHHDHDHRHEHDHEHEHVHEEAADHHADLMVEYHYLCADADQLKRLELPLMGDYPGIETLEVQLLTPFGQHLRQLGSGEQELPLP